MGQFSGTAAAGVQAFKHTAQDGMNEVINSMVSMRVQFKSGIISYYTLLK